MKAWLVLGLCAAVYGKHETYIGWKVYAVEPSTSEQLQILVSLIDTYELDFLSYADVNYEGITLVKPQYQAAFTEALTKLQVKHRIYADDVKIQLDMDDLKIESRNNVTLRNGKSLLPYDNYQELDVIYDYLTNIAQNYPDTVTLVTAARSFRGRPIQYLKISTTNFEDASKPIIFIIGGVHSREWIAPATITWAIHKLVEDVTEPDLLENFDWILLPVLNTDGYEFTFTNDRLWRKNRSTLSNPLGLFCPGVDCDRNFDFYWNDQSYPLCSALYPGNRAFSENESRAVRDIINNNLDRMAMFLNMGSFGSRIFYPWGNDGTLSQNALALHAVGIAMAEAIDDQSLPYFPRYVVGNAVLMFNHATVGSAMDYAHLMGVPLSFSVMLPGLNSRMNGFLLDPIYIQPVVKETWAGITAGVRRAVTFLK